MARIQRLQLLLSFFVLLSGILRIKSQSALLPAPSEVYVTFRNDDPTTVDLHWIYNASSLSSLSQISTFVINITYVGPCTLEQADSITSIRIAKTYTETNYTHTLSSLQEYSNYSISIEGVAPGLNRSTSTTLTFQTQIGVPGEVSGVVVTFVNSSAMTVEWQPLSCFDENGVIVNYNVSFTNRDISLRPSQFVTVRLRVHQLEPPFRFTYNELSPSSNYAVTVVAVNNRHVYSNVLRPVLTESTIAAGFTGFMLKGRRYIENELVALDQIEENDGALLCLTTNLSCCSSTFTSSNKGIGEWYFPNDTTVPIKSQSHTAYRNRGNGTLRLNVKRTKERVPSDLEGIFTCEIPDGQGVMRNLTIAIFSRERGILRLESEIQFERVASADLCCESKLHLTFITTGGPPTGVVWEVNNATLTTLNNNETVATKSLVVNKREATFVHSINITTSNVSGFYQVTVMNSISRIITNITITEISFQLLFGGLEDCQSWIAQNSGTPSQMIEQTIFNAVWTRLQQNCQDVAGIRVQMINSSLLCSDDGDYMTFRATLNVNKPQSSFKFLLSCVDQLSSTAGKPITVQGRDLRVLGGCPFQISSLDQPPCIVVKDSNCELTQCDDQASLLPLNTPSLLFLIVVASVLCICLTASIILNIIFILCTSKYKKKLNVKLADNNNSTHGFTNVSATELTPVTSRGKKATHVENPYQPSQDVSMISRSNTIGTHQLTRRNSERSSGKPAVFIPSSQSSHNISLTQSGRIVHVKTEPNEQEGVDNVKPPVIVSNKLGRTKRRHNAENIPSPEIDGDGEDYYTDILPRTREKPHNYANLNILPIISSTENPTVYAVPGPRVSGEADTRRDGRENIYNNAASSACQYMNLQ